MLRGLAFEDWIANKYAAETGCKFRKGLRLTHPDYKWWWGTPDRFIDDEAMITVRNMVRAGMPEHSAMWKLGYKGGIAEFKCPRPSVYWRYEREGVPAMYICQVQWYLMHPYFEWCDLYIYNIVDMERILIRFEPEPEIQLWMAAEAEKFVQCVRSKTHPDYDVAPMTITPRHKPEVRIVEGEEWQRVMGKLIEGKPALDAAKEFYETAIDEAVAMMGEDGLVQGYGGRISAPWMDGRRTLDEKRLQAEHPELRLEDYKNQGNPYRRPRFTPLKEIGNG